jgi:hypothetical protein
VRRMTGRLHGCWPGWHPLPVDVVSRDPRSAVPVAAAVLAWPAIRFAIELPLALARMIGARRCDEESVPATDVFDPPGRDSGTQQPSIKTIH